jgi:hypothetical protein
VWTQFRACLQNNCPNLGIYPAYREYSGCSDIEICEGLSPPSLRL